MQEETDAPKDKRRLASRTRSEHVRSHLVPQARGKYRARPSVAESHRPQSENPRNPAKRLPTPGHGGVVRRVFLLRPDMLEYCWLANGLLEAGSTLGRNQDSLRGTG